MLGHSTAGGCPILARGAHPLPDKPVNTGLHLGCSTYWDWQLLIKQLRQPLSFEQESPRLLCISGLLQGPVVCSKRGVYSQGCTHLSSLGTLAIFPAIIELSTLQGEFLRGSRVDILLMLGETALQAVCSRGRKLVSTQTSSVQ